MKTLQDVLEAAVANGDTPGVAATVADRNGVIFEGAAGHRAIGGDQPMTLDSVFRIFSMTKAVGTVAAMQLVEEGRLSLDAPVADILPDFADVKVLEGFDGDRPILREPKRPCTVRHLATHTSGLVYDVWNADQMKYMELTGGQPTLTGAKAALKSFHMQFDPGTRWAYGMGTDWLGLVVEEIAGEEIDAILKRRIFGPLGMSSTDVEFSGDMGARKVAVHARTPDGFQVIEMDLPSKPEFYGMGHALNSTAPDYLRFCRMILNGGELDGERVLKAETVARMSENAIGDLRLTKQKTTTPALGGDIDLFPDIEKTYSLALMRNEADVPDRRRAGSLSWAGVMNTHYWIDPTTGIAAVIMMQHLPFVDEAALKVYGDFERAVYAGLRESQAAR